MIDNLLQSLNEIAEAAQSGDMLALERAGDQLNAITLDGDIPLEQVLVLQSALRRALSLIEGARAGVSTTRRLLEDLANLDRLATYTAQGNLVEMLPRGKVIASF